MGWLVYMGEKTNTFWIKNVKENEKAPWADVSTDTGKFVEALKIMQWPTNAQAKVNLRFSKAGHRKF